MKMVATIGKWRGIRRDGARDRNRTYKDRSPVDFESTASASSATRARRKSYHKSVRIEGSARASLRREWFLRLAWRFGHRETPLCFNKTRHAAAVLGVAAA